MDAPVLEVDGLQTQFLTARGVVRAVDGASFSIRPGRGLGLLGPGGRVAAGSIRFKDVDILRLPERALRELRGNRVAIVFQDPLTSLTPSMRVGEQIVETILTHRRIPR